MANKFLDLTGLSKFKENLKALFDDTYIKKQGYNATRPESSTENGFSLSIHSSDGINSGIGLINDGGSTTTFLYPDYISTPRVETKQISADESLYIKTENSGNSIFLQTAIGSSTALNMSSGSINIKSDGSEGHIAESISFISGSGSITLNSQAGSIYLKGNNIYSNGTNINQLAIHSYGYDDSYNIGRNYYSENVENKAFNYYWIKYNNGIMVLNIQYVIGGEEYDGLPARTHTVTFPVSFINNKYVPIVQSNKAEAGTNGIRVYLASASDLTFVVESVNTALNEAGYAEGQDVVSIQCVGRWK